MYSLVCTGTSSFHQTATLKAWTRVACKSWKSCHKNLLWSRVINKSLIRKWYSIFNYVEVKPNSCWKLSRLADDASVFIVSIATISVIFLVSNGIRTRSWSSCHENSWDINSCVVDGTTRYIFLGWASYCSTKWFKLQSKNWWNWNRAVRQSCVVTCVDWRWNLRSSCFDWFGTIRSLCYLDILIKFWIVWLYALHASILRPTSFDITNGCDCPRGAWTN